VSLTALALVELLWNIHRRIGRRLAPLAQDEGMSMTELVVLYKAQKTGSWRVTALAEDLGVAPSTLTGVIDRLVDQGWLERSRDPDDRRAVVISSTEKLGELLRSLRQALSRVLEKALHDLPAETRDRLGADLTAVLECLDRHEGDK
jgi:DNA-binding MarR family transcriptional regulator